MIWEFCFFHQENDVSLVSLVSLVLVVFFYCYLFFYITFMEKIDALFVYDPEFCLGRVEFEDPRVREKKRCVTTAE